MKPEFFDKMEDIMYRSGFDNSMSILVAMRGPLDFRFRGKWYYYPYLVYTAFTELVALTNLLTIGIRFLSPGVNVLERCFTGFAVTSISLSTFRVGYLFLRRKKFYDVMLQYDSLYNDSPELIEDVAKNANVIRYIPRLLALLTALPMGPWCFMPILNALRGEKWAVSVPSTWPFDPVESIYTFVLVAVLQSLSAAINTLRVVLFDNMFYCYACRQLALTKHLSRELARILSVPRLDNKCIASYIGNEGKVLTKNAASSYVRKELRQWVINHQHSLRLANELQVLFSPWLLFQYSLISISCCTTAFVVVFSNSDLLNIALCFLYAIGNSLELLITCRIGDLITEESKNLEHAADNTHVYLLDPSIYKVWMKTILTRAKESIKLSALGVYPLNTETFKSIMVTTYSFFTLLMSMKERQEKVLT